MQWIAGNPLRAFTLLSFGLIGLTIAATGIAQSILYRDAILEREANIVRDLVRSRASDRLSIWDVENFASPDARRRYDDSFALLKSVSGVARIKVYDRDGRVIWSDDPGLVGRQVLPTDEARRAMAGSGSVVFEPLERESHRDEHLPDGDYVEFYVPLLLPGPAGGAEQVAGLFAFYRSADDLNSVLRRGIVLIWIAVGGGGLLLYAGLFQVFRVVVRQRREAETRLIRVTAEQERLVQLEKLSAIGTAVGEIAHQLNNPLVGVINLAQLAERDAGNPQQVRALLRQIREAGEHCSAFVKRMLEFTRVSRSERKTVDLSALVNETVALFRQSGVAGTDVVCRLPTGSAMIDADPVLVRHAIFNLLSNAAQASPPGAAVELVVEPREGPGGAGWEIAIEDRGPGLGPAVRERLFTPFFSTRPGGTGLGLAVVAHVAAVHRGTIAVDNRSGGGARAVLWLPSRWSGEAG